MVKVPCSRSIKSALVLVGLVSLLARGTRASPLRFFVSLSDSVLEAARPLRELGVPMHVKWHHVLALARARHRWLEPWRSALSKSSDRARIQSMPRGLRQVVVQAIVIRLARVVPGGTPATMARLLRRLSFGGGAEDLCADEFSCRLILHSCRLIMQPTFFGGNYCHGDLPFLQPTYRPFWGQAWRMETVL